MTESQKKAETIAQGVLSYLRKSGEESLLGDVVQRLIKEADKKEKAVVYSPIELSDTEKEAAIKIVKKLLRKEPQMVIFETNPALLDGLQVRFGDHFWDLSLSGQVNQLLKKLKSN